MPTGAKPAAGAAGAVGNWGALTGSRAPKPPTGSRAPKPAAGALLFAHPPKAGVAGAAGCVIGAAGCVTGAAGCLTGAAGCEKAAGLTPVVGMAAAGIPPAAPALANGTAVRTG
jgi:hypothetical protein